MATSGKNLSGYNPESIPNAEDMKFGVIVADWNSEVTHALLKGAIDTLLAHHVKKENILERHVPGTFELTIGAQFFAEYTNVDAIICLGCVIQGETRHFDFICQGVTHGITEVSMNYNVPCIFGVLTTQNQEQAIDRAGGKHGNKGVEAAVTAIQMVGLHENFKQLEEGKFFLN